MAPGATTVTDQHNAPPPRSLPNIGPAHDPQPFALDVNDLALLAGAVLLGVGLAAIDPWLLVAAIGAALIAYSLRR